MKLHFLIFAAAALLASAAYADDHLVQATLSGGLIADEATDTILNKAGQVIPDKAPGQGSPFIGEHHCTPATANEAAHDHANVKPRGPDAGDCAP
jgi:hypothetical protein